MSIIRSIGSRFMGVGFSRKGAAMETQLREASADVAKAQRMVLTDIVGYAESTAYGKAHGFGAIRSAKDFANAVPINNYEDLRPWVARHEKGEANVLFPGKPLFYATTSGTTDAPKRIPISRKYNDSCYRGLSNLWLHSLFQQNPGFMDGCDISMVGKAVEGYTPDGTPYGSFSGHMNGHSPEFVKRFRVMPFEVHDIDDYPSKYYALLRVGLAYPIRWIVAANPSNLLELHRSAMSNMASIIEDIHNGTLNASLNIAAPIRRQIEHRLKPNRKRARALEKLTNTLGDALRPKHYWPTLQLVNTWKSGNAAIYLGQTSDFYPDHTVIREFGYLATEARAGIVLDNDWETSILAAHLLYFEFVDRADLSSVNPVFLGAHQLEKGREYAVYITTPGGLYRYDINDIVRVEDFYGTFPMVRFIQKGSGVTSLTGEKLYESQYLQAVSETARLLNTRVGFHVAFADISNSRYHCFMEPAHNGAKIGESTEQFAVALDGRLMQINPEYATKRNSNRLQPLVVSTLRPNAFSEYKQQKLNTGQREGQFKMTHLQQNDDQLKIFQSMSMTTGGTI